MQTYFSLQINGIDLDFISMNITGPKLFQVFTTVEGQKTRYHLQGNGVDQLSFAMPDQCPQFLLDIEDQISDAIFQLLASK